jgi:ribonuclease HI/retron-type reverse transcriptase
MYHSPTARAGDNWLGGAHTRQVPAESHTGSYADYLRRHERECGMIATATRQERHEFAACLLDRATDTRNLMCAIDQLTRERDKAPGPSGTKLELLAKHERWDLCHQLHDLLQDGTYVPDDVWRKQIPKSSGDGTRPLEIASQEDLVVQRAIVQVIQPYLDPLFDVRSHGYRPRHSREQALAMAEYITHRENRYVWLAEDLRDAFTTVPQRRLLDILRHHGLPDSLVDLIHRAIGQRRRGIPQGGCLSPLLLNVYLNWMLDRPWRRLHPDIPLIRVADDLLILCRSSEEAQVAYDDLARLVRQIGMLLKGTPEKAIVDLNCGRHVNWLGYRITKDGSRIVAHIRSRAWNNLSGKLALAHHKPQSPLRAYQTVLGWVDQQGPSYSQAEAPRAYARVISLAHQQAFDELPSLEEFQQRWESAHIRYIRLRRVLWLSMANGTAEGSASRHRETADIGCGDGVPAQGAPSPSLTVTLVTDGACETSSRIGGWAFILTNHGTGQELIRADSHPRATNNKMELTAVVRGLEALEATAAVTLVSDSRYVIDGLTQHLSDWRDTDWRRRGGGKLANARLWQRLDELVHRHRVQCQWVRGHTGDPANEFCDQLAREAILSHSPECCTPQVGPAPAVW